MMSLITWLRDRFPSKLLVEKSANKLLVFGLRRGASSATLFTENDTAIEWDGEMLYLETLLADVLGNMRVTKALTSAIIDRLETMAELRNNHGSIHLRFQDEGETFHIRVERGFTHQLRLFF